MSSKNAETSKVTEAKGSNKRFRCSCKKVSVEFTTPDGEVWRDIVIDHRCHVPTQIRKAKSVLKREAMKYYMSTLKCVVNDVDE